MIDLFVLVVERLVRSPAVGSGRGKLETGNGRGGEVPEPDTFSLRGKFASAGALAAAVALFVVDNGLVTAAVATLSLWYVLALGGVMGATGLALGRVGTFTA